MGAIDPRRFEKTLQQIGLAYTFKSKLALGDVFDEAFLPQADPTNN